MAHTPQDLASQPDRRGKDDAQRNHQHTEFEQLRTTENFSENRVGNSHDDMHHQNGQQHPDPDVEPFLLQRHEYSRRCHPDQRSQYLKHSHRVESEQRSKNRSAKQGEEYRQHVDKVPTAKEAQAGKHHQPCGTPRKKYCSAEKHRMCKRRNRMHLEGGSYRPAKIDRWLEPYSNDQREGQNAQDDSPAKVPQCPQGDEEDRRLPAQHANDRYQTKSREGTAQNTPYHDAENGQRECVQQERIVEIVEV